MKKNKTSDSFEKDMKELEDIVVQMNRGSLSLEKSMELFEKGLKLSKKCSSRLNQAQQKVQKIVNSNTDEDIELEDVSSPANS